MERRRVGAGMGAATWWRRMWGGGGLVTRWRQWGGRLLWSSVVEEVRLVKFVASWSPSTK
jgi:hypothetical protein